MGKSMKFMLLLWNSISLMEIVIKGQSMSWNDCTVILFTDLEVNYSRPTQTADIQDQNHNEIWKNDPW